MECPNKNKFCVVCGLFVPFNKGKNVTKAFVDKYEQYFLINMVPKAWYIPEVVCNYCYKGLLRSKQFPIKYVYPVIWLKRSEHSRDLCYFCRNQPNTIRLKNQDREKIVYHKCDSVQPAVLRSTSNPKAPSEEVRTIPCDDLELLSIGSRSELYSEFLPIGNMLADPSPHFITQADFDDLVRDTNISQRSAEVLGSRLQQWKLVSEDFRVTSVRKRSNEQSFDACFKVDDQTGITYADDVEKLFETIGHSYDPNEWRLFIDGSTKSLKGVLLHVGNVYPSVPIIYGTDVKENYENISAILKLINYDRHCWMICSDLKIVAILMGLKKGFAKHQCFLCLWEGRRKDLHYTDHKWQPRIVHQLGQDSIENIPLVPSSKIILPPLHIKLGLIRNFVRALDVDSAAMVHLKKIFPKLSEAKIDAGVFNGPQLKKLLNCKEFPNLLSPIEKNSWRSLDAIIENFLGNRKSENYEEIVRNLVRNFGEMGVNMSLKIHFLDRHLDFFPDNLGHFSDEHGERFHQDLAIIENRFRGKSTCRMLAKYCWSICRDSHTPYKRQSKRIHFSP